MLSNCKFEPPHSSDWKHQEYLHWCCKEKIHLWWLVAVSSSLFYSQALTSLITFQEGGIAIILTLLLVNILSKWGKSLLMIINLEAGTAVIISALWAFGPCLSVSFVIVLVFFVSEALVILSALYSSLRSLGSSSGGLVFN